MNIVIRPEVPRDFAEITAITQAAFKDHPYSQQTEHLIIEKLRAENALTVSLVSEYNGEVVGHIAFSPVTIDGVSDGWFGLGPLSVRPDFQRHGIGLKLIDAGLQRLRELGASGCVLAGDPNYYCRRGFKADSRVTLAGVPAQFFLVLPLGKTLPSGEARFHPAFDL